MISSMEKLQVIRIKEKTSEQSGDKMREICPRIRYPEKSVINADFALGKKNHQYHTVIVTHHIGSVTNSSP